jgi:hypothetical protein
MTAAAPASVADMATAASPLRSLPKAKAAAGDDARARPARSALGAIVLVVRLRLRRRLAWIAWRAQHGGQPPEALELLLDDGDRPDREAHWQATTPEIAPLNAEIATAEASLADTRHEDLVEALELHDGDVAVLQLAMAVAAEPALRTALAALEGSRPPVGPTACHAARLFGLGRVVAVGPQAPVRRWRLVSLAPAEAGAPAVLVADPAIVAWLAGGLLDDEGLAAQPVPALAPLPGWPVEATVARVREMTGPCRIRVVGPAAIGRRTFAANVAAATGHRLFAVTATGIGADDGERWTLACRRARLMNERFAWVGPPPSGAADPPCCFVVATPQESSLPGALELPVELPLPDIGTRRMLWQRHLPSAATWPDGALDRLAIAHRLSVGELRDAARHGSRTPEEAGEVVRLTGRGALAGLAQRLRCPFTFEDLVVGDALRVALDDFVYEARERLLVWEDAELRRLFPQGTGLMAMFCGPSGTGKTMTAQVVAGALGLDLYRIDLAAVVSKYIGETTRNIDRILATASRMDVVLFFDEADALFGRRTDIRDAHDRYANTDTNFLLQAIEAYPGIALLATNRKGNVDSAFMRRLRHVFDFPPPDAGLRTRLWRRLVAAIGGSDAARSNVATLPALAAAFEMSGAQIKYAVLHALYAARRDNGAIRVRHLIAGVERELLKEGRGLARGERDRLLAKEAGR